MADGPSLVLVANLLATLAAAAMAGFFWRRRRELHGGTLLVVVSLAAAVWAGCYSASMVATGFEAKLFWYRLRYPGNAFGALTWFLFVTIYTGHGEHVTRRRVAALVALEALSVAVVWTNQTPFHVGFHRLWYEGMALTSVGGVTIVDPSAGLLYWAYTGFNGFLFLLAAGFLFELLIRPEQRIHGRRNLALLGGSFVPFALNIVFKLLGDPLDPTPIGLAFSMCFSAYAIFGFGIFDVVPVARASVVEQLDVGVVVFDNVGTVIDANRLATQLLGGGSSLVGRPATALFADAVRPDGEGDADEPRSVSTLTAAGSDYVLEYTPPGSDRVYEVNTSALDGGDLGHVALLSDVTTSRLREGRLRAQNAQLDEFASIVSHDLRNPLNVAVGYLQLAREDSDDESLARVDSALDRMEALIGDLLTLARSGQVIGETESVSLTVVAREAWSHVRTESATLSVDDDRTVEADAVRLVELLENLFRNSVEHGSTSSRTGSGDSVEHAGPDVAVRVGVTPEGFFLEDDGPGLSPERRELVFERGYTTARTGTGFGLAIVQEIVLAHGWDIEVTEGTQGGARFEVRTVPASAATGIPPDGRVAMSDRTER